MNQNQVKETLLRGEISGNVRDLSGFLGFHREPEDCSLRAQRFVQQAGTQDLADRATDLFNQIRRTFSYKRKELALDCDEGGASIKTPDFDATLTLTQAPEIPAIYRITLELSSFRNPEILATNAFSSLFNSRCDTAVMLFAKPIDLPARIDQIEEQDALAALLDYDAACSWFTLRLPRLVITVSTSHMLFKLPGENDLSLLIDQTKAALAQLTGIGGVLEQTDDGLA